MDTIFKDITKIKIYAQIQRDLCNLKPCVKEEEIDLLFETIPPDFLTQKDELMMICQLFAYSARIHQTSMKRNAIKLFNRILSNMKEYLQNESSFFWNIFGGLFYFKLWMHKEGLISIEQIISSSQVDQSSTVLEYFLPEIIEEEPEIFEREIKAQIKFQYSDESIQKFKEIRQKHWNWLQESGDYHDPSYIEIEENRLRLAIKTDDVDSFQRIVSNLCLSVNSTIRESIIENFLRNPSDIPLIEYALHFNSINIFKFLFLNDAKIDNKIVYGSIQSNNCEIIHIIESKITKGYEEDSLPSSIECWNDDMTNYLLNNYDFEFFQEKEANITNVEFVICLLSETFYSLNFIFFESTLLPFFKNNPSFIEKNINDILMETFSEMSGFFTREFSKYPGLDINYHLIGFNISFMAKAIQEQNARAIEILLNNPNIDVNDPCFMSIPSLHFACKFHSDMKVVKMICECPKYKDNSKDGLSYKTAFTVAVTCGNFYAARYLIDKYNNWTGNDLKFFFLLCIQNHNFFTLKIIMKKYLEINKTITAEQIISDFQGLTNFKEFPDIIRTIIQEIKLA